MRSNGSQIRLQNRIPILICYILLHNSQIDSKMTTAFRLSLLALLCLTSQSSDILQGECTAKSYCEGNPTGRNVTLKAREEDDAGSTEASFVSPAPKSYGGLGADLGEPQTIDQSYADEMMEKIEEARRYMRDEVLVNPKYDRVRSICKNKHALCTYWSVLGECSNNPAYMNINCAPVCGVCEVRLD